MEVAIKSVNQLSAWMVPQLVMSALAGSLLIVLAAAWLRFFQAPSASTRHFIWLLAIAIPLCLPIASWLLPRSDLGPITWSGLGSGHVAALNHASPLRTTARTASTSTPRASMPAQRVGATTQSSIQLSSSALVLGVWLVGVMIPMSRWFNPLSWYAYRRLGNECELASDDLTLNTGCDPCDYAETLLIVSRWSREARVPLLPALAMATTSMLEGRVRAILSPSRNRGSVCRRTSIGISVVASSIVCGLAMLQPDDATAQPIATNRPTTQTIRGSDSNQPGQRGSTDHVITLSHVDDSADGRRSIAGSGHAVQFELPASSGRHADRYLLAVEIYASRYGHEQPPDEDFHVYVLDEEQRLIAAFPIAYATIQRGHERWYTLPIAPTAVPQQFFVAVTFNPHRTKGIYMAYDDCDDPSHSFVGRPTSGWKPLREGRNWMIRAVTATTGTPPNPFD